VREEEGCLVNPLPNLRKRKVEIAGEKTSLKKCNEKLGETEAGGWMCSECDKVCPESIESWQYHLQQLAITPPEERINYLYKYLKAKDK